ncbi:MAG TPA: hypothetical protein VGQ59_19710 [Cyclobacteriaceae bacterium]|jgi:hypothetical protein|nr:hypothetical protein [Cyclobacteriaceae bacterium]
MKNNPVKRVVGFCAILCVFTFSSAFGPIPNDPVTILPIPERPVITRPDPSNVFPVGVDWNDELADFLESIE